VVKKIQLSAFRYFAPFVIFRGYAPAEFRLIVVLPLCISGGIPVIFPNEIRMFGRSGWKLK
jgi:hypothetical protein